jgi:hypothetical protein
VCERVIRKLFIVYFQPAQWMSQKIDKMLKHRTNEGRIS